MSSSSVDISCFSVADGELVCCCFFCTLHCWKITLYHYIIECEINKVNYWRWRWQCKKSTTTTTTTKKSNKLRKSCEISVQMQQQQQQQQKCVSMGIWCWVWNTFVTPRASCCWHTRHIDYRRATALLFNSVTTMVVSSMTPCLWESVRVHIWLLSNALRRMWHESRCYKYLFALVQFTCIYICASFYIAIRMFLVRCCCCYHCGLRWSNIAW